MSTARVVANVVGFQAAWWALVLSAAAGRAALGLAAAAVVVAVHLTLNVAPLREAQALVAVAVLGTVWDSIPVALGYVDYRGAAPLAFAAPYWIVALWLVFATTLNGALRWLRARPLVAASLGASVGPLCYLAGEGLGALAFVSPVGIAVQAAGWALLLPVGLRLAARFERGGATPLRERAHV